jgi:hypothetical protein
MHVIMIYIAFSLLPHFPDEVMVITVQYKHTHNNACRSTRNSRIEQLWVEVGTQFVRRWRAFFTWLDRLHSLNRKTPAHLWLLHDLFLDAINDDCQEFQTDWNAHPVSGSGTNDKSPAVSQTIGSA